MSTLIEIDRVIKGFYCICTLCVHWYMSSARIGTGYAHVRCELVYRVYGTVLVSKSTSVLTMT